MAAAVSPTLHAAAALLCFAWIGLILGIGRRWLALPHAVACLAAAGWAATFALAPEAPWPAVAEALRNGTWVGVLVWLSLSFGDVRARPIAWRFAAAGGIICALAIAAAALDLSGHPNLGSPALLAPVSLALLVMMAAENLYRNSEDAVRWHVILPCIGLAGLAGFDVVLHVDAALSNAYSGGLLDSRAVLTVITMPLLAVGAARGRRWKRSPPITRPVVFHGATLIIAGTFLVGVGAVGEAFRRSGVEWGRTAQPSLLAGALLVLVVAASSRSIRSHARRLLVDQFFAARFDYRREWLRCVATLSAHGADAQGRAVIALADPVDSPGGVLLLQDPGQSTLRWAGSWNMPETPIHLPADHAMLASMRGGAWVTTTIPEDVRVAYGPLWLAVPLLHHREGLFGAVILAPPRAPFKMDGEAFDLLRVVGREVAMFLAERRAAERLNDQRRLQEYASRFAFVAHDVKTVGHQLSMLLTNAQDHMDDPEFQQDMLLTVDASAKRIGTLIARLRQPGEAEPAVGEASPVTQPLERLRAMLPAIAHPVELRNEEELADCLLGIAPDSFDSALRHLLDNAAEASPAGIPVRIGAHRDNGRLTIDIIDRGEGMTAEFVRDTLFRPLVSGKPGGSGIGAWQARDLLRNAGGDLVALSQPGTGTTMRLTLPCAVAGTGEAIAA